LSHFDAAPAVPSHDILVNYPALVAATPLASLWSYESSVRGRMSDPPHHYWLHRSDPLLNTILPGTHVSIVLNGFADVPASGCARTSDAAHGC
jgi:hypothetical protein